MTNIKIEFKNTRTFTVFDCETRYENNIIFITVDGKVKYSIPYYSIQYIEYQENTNKIEKGQECKCSIKGEN